MIISDESTTDQQKIADAFNIYFSNVAKKLDDEITNLGSSDSFDGLFDADVNLSKFFIYLVTKYERENLISYLNNTYYGLDNLSGRMLGTVKDLLSYLF